MSAIINEFNAAVFVSEQLNRMIINAAQELAQRAVSKCADKYDFDAAEAIKFLGLQNIKVERNRPEKAAKAPKEKAVKAAFPMPWNNVCIAGCCSALRQNQGLYTQCTGSLKKNAVFCKQCQVNADKNGGVPEYGTVAMRQAVGLYDYVDPKGRKPVSFTKIMKKYKVDQAAAMEEAAKFGINIDAEHFIVPEADKKKGRPKAEKAPKEKGAKGRPKKAKKMLQIEGDDDDLFASLVADANANTSAEPEKKKRGKSDEEKAAEEAKKAEEKAEKAYNKEMEAYNKKVAELALKQITKAECVRVSERWNGVVNVDFNLPAGSLKMPTEVKQPETTTHKYEYENQKREMENAIRILKLSDEEVVSTSTYQAVAQYL